MTGFEKLKNRTIFKIRMIAMKAILSVFKKYYFCFISHREPEIRKVKIMSVTSFIDKYFHNQLMVMYRDLRRKQCQKE